MTEFNDSPYLSYFQSIKVKKFESNSQRVDEVTSMEKGCFHSVKVIKI